MEFGNPCAITVRGDFERPQRVFIAHQHDAHAENIFLGHHVAAYIAAPRRPSILDVIDVVVVDVIQRAFFTELLN